MNKTLFTFALFGLTIGSIIFIGCEKKELSPQAYDQLPETNIHIVTEKIAQEVANNFNSDSLYGPNNGTNHYPL